MQQIQRLKDRCFKDCGDSNFLQAKRFVPAGNLQIVFELKYNGLGQGIKAAFDKTTLVSGECYDNCKFTLQY